MDVVRPAVQLEAHEILVFAVVDDDPSAEASCAIGPHQPFELAASDAAAEPAGDEHRLPVAWDPSRAERIEHGRERIAPGILGRRRQGEGRRLDDDRRPARARRGDVKRRAGKRVSKRLDDGRAHIDERIERWRRCEQHRVVGNRDERKTRAGRERDAHSGHPRSGSRACG